MKNLRPHCWYSRHAVLHLLFLWFASMTMAADSSPNVVFILTDDQGWNGTSVRMDPDLPESASDFHQTPNLEALAAEGMRFSNAYAAASVCAPTRASIVTGMSTAQLQMGDIIDASIVGSRRFKSAVTGQPLAGIVPSRLNPDDVTIAERVKQFNPNYVTANFGKNHLFLDQATLGYDISSPPGGGDPNTDPRRVFSLSDRANDFMTDRVAANEPFFLQISHIAPHAPLEAQPETLAKYESLPPGERHDNPLFAALTEDLDTAVGTVLDKIQELGIEDNTYIIFTSDHGAREQDTTNAPLYKGKASLWEGGIRVPLIVKGPGIEANTTSHEPVVSADIYTTISDLIGVTDPLPQNIEGASWSPLLFNAGELPSGVESLQRQYAPNGELYFHQPVYMAGGRLAPMSAVRDGDFKLVKLYGENGAADAIYLFNINENIRESNWLAWSGNLANSMPEKTAELLAKLDNYLQASDASIPYVVSDDVQLVWDASQREGHRDAGPNTWRSTVDVDYKARETWAATPNIAPYPVAETGIPSHVQVANHQPGLGDHAFHFDGDDWMTRKYFHVGHFRIQSANPPLSPDLDRSASFEFWLRQDSLDHEQVLFESGDESAGLSVTFGDGDSDGVHDELRVRVLGKDGTNLSLTSDIDQFANPVNDFVQIVAVLNDSNEDRYAEIYVNGARFGRVDGSLGTEGSLIWDSYDFAGLGGAGGAGFGGNSGDGDLPFAGGNFLGDIALFKYYNHAIAADKVLDNYNSLLHPVDLGVAATGGDVQSPSARPSNVSEGVLEGNNSVLVIQERNDRLDEDLAVDILAVGGSTYGSGGLTENLDGVLPADTEFTSYLLHFDPEGTPVTDDTAIGSVTFDSPILALIVDQDSLAATDPLLGTIGQYTSGPRAANLDSDIFTLSSDRRTLELSLAAQLDEVVHVRLLTAAALLPGDYNRDGVVDTADYNVWRSGYGSESLPAADGNGDGIVNQLDYLVWRDNMHEFSSTANETPVPEPSSMVVLSWLMGVFHLRMRWSRR